MAGNKKSEISNSFFPGLNFKSEWMVFFWCLVVAILFWFLKVLEEDYQYKLSFNINYENLPDDRVFIKPLPEKLDVIVNAPGWQLAGHWFRQKAPTINLDYADFEHDDNFVPANYRERISRQISPKMAIIDYYPDTLKFHHEPEINRTVHVVLDLEISFNERFNLNQSINYEPDSITVSGPESIINDLDYVKTEPVRFNDLSKAVRKHVALVKPENTAVRYETGHITLNIPVERLTEKKLTVPLSIKNENPRFELKLMPQNVELTFQTPLSRYQNIRPDGFDLYVDAKLAYTDSLNRLPVVLESSPPFIYSLRIQPEFTDYYLIEKELTQE